MTFIEQFENIKSKSVGADTSSLPHDLAAQINLTDEDCGGIFYIANIGGNFAVEPYDYHDHTVMLTVNSKDLLDIIDGKTDAADAYFRGILSVEGNLDHALEIAKVLKQEKKPAKKTAKKAAEKKTAAKKAPAKKPAAKKTTTAAKKTAAKKPAAKKTAEKKTPAKKTAKK